MPGKIRPYQSQNLMYICHNSSKMSQNLSKDVGSANQLRATYKTLVYIHHQPSANNLGGHQYKFCLLVVVNITPKRFCFCCCELLLKDGDFVPCEKTINAINIANLFFIKIVWMHGVPKTITSDHNINLMSHIFRSSPKEI